MERTKEQDECVKFYHNLKKINEEMEKYKEANNLAITAKNRSKDISKNSDNYSKWQTVIGLYEDKARKALENATEAYKALLKED